MTEREFLSEEGLSFAAKEVGLVFDGQTVFEDVTFEIEPGEIVALVGPSGAGKTSCLRLLNGTQRPTSGEILAGGQVLSGLGAREMRERRSAIGFVPQSFGLIPNLRVAQNVITGRVGRMSTWRALRSVLRQNGEELDEIHAILERLGIGDKLFQRVDSLSGGEQQRVAIARALYQRPGALLADEPLSALDPARARETLALLIDVAREHGLTLIASLHDIVLARELLPRLIGLRGGRLRFDLPTDEVGDERIEELYGIAADSAPRGSDGP